MHLKKGVNPQILSQHLANMSEKAGKCVLNGGYALTKQMRQPTSQYGIAVETKSTEPESCMWHAGCW